MRELAVREWGERLASLTGEQIKRGLDDWHGEWPPNVEQFRRACMGTGNLHNTAAYRRFQRSLPKPKADASVVAAELAKMRGTTELTAEQMLDELARLKGL
jgi:hypothetical protein